MSVKIRLKRLGKVRVPQYRIVVVDSRKKRDGKVIEEIGLYHPKEEPSYITVVSDRAQYWLGVGAQPSEAVAKILRITGDWQKHRGIAGTEGTLKVAEVKRNKQDIFNEALKEAASEPRSEAVTKKSAPKKAEKADKPAIEDKKTGDKKTDDKKSDDKPAAKVEKTDEKAGEKPAETPAPVEVPASETPEGAAVEAEAAEAKTEPSA